MFKDIKKAAIAIAVILFANIAFASAAAVFAQKEEQKSENGEKTAMELSAPSAILIEQSTGKVLFEKNADEQMPPASVTKVMTMLLVMEAVDSGKISFDDMVMGSENAKSMGGSTIFLDAGEQMSVYDLMKGVAVASGNDAAVALAEFVAGSEEGFVEMMNKRAQELGMTNTTFKNPNGLDTQGHLTTARDIAVMSAELLRHKRIFEFTTIWMDSLRDGKFTLANTNKLIRFYDGANGLKTGSTSIAKNCISASAMRNDMQLIAVVMAAPTSAQRFADAKKLLDYGFANYCVSKAVNAGEDMGRADVVKGLESSVAAAAKDNFCVLTRKGENGDIRCENVFNENINAPVNDGDEIGKINIYKGDSLIGDVSIVAVGGVKKLTYYAMVSKLLRKWVCF